MEQLGCTVLQRNYGILKKSLNPNDSLLVFAIENSMITEKQRGVILAESGDREKQVSQTALKNQPAKFNEA